MSHLPPPPPRSVSAVRPAGQAADGSSDPSPWIMLAVVFGGLTAYEVLKYAIKKV